MNSKISSRSILSLLILVALLYIVGINELVSTVLAVRVEYVLLLVLLSAVMIWASCLKWQLFVAQSGAQVSILLLMKLYTIGYFFNSFMPSYVGGDIARSLQLSSYIQSKRIAFISTFLERFTGLLAMSLLGCFFVSLGTAATDGIEYVIVCVGVISTSGALVCFSSPIADLSLKWIKAALEFLVPHPWKTRLVSLCEKFFDSMAFARSNPLLFLRALLYSFLFHCLAVLNTYLAARAIGWQEPDILRIFVVLPLILLVGMIPLTPNGIGLQEGAFMFFLERIGASTAEALSVGLILSC